MRRFAPAVYSTDPMTLVTSGAELVVEAAGIDAARQHAPGLVLAGCNLIIMSVGCLADDDFRRNLELSASTTGRQIAVPSGAIAGLDAVQAAAVGSISSLVLTTRKHPSALIGAPFLVARGDDLSGLQGPTLIFEGDALDAIAAFPANANVAVALGLAAGLTRAIQVRVIADPTVNETQHEVALTGEFGTMTTRVSSKRLLQNPRTSELAAMSAIAAVRRFCSPIKVG
jgi:aspartate dehydrogenase